MKMGEKWCFKTAVFRHFLRNEEEFQKFDVTLPKLAIEVPAYRISRRPAQRLDPNLLANFGDWQQQWS